MDKLPLSVALISFNEEDRIASTLSSVADIAEEIILVDSYSADRTRDIAVSYGVKVFLEVWKGFREQKNSALEKCSCDWVLFLDCDELIGDDLKLNIKNLVESAYSNTIAGARIERRSFYNGKLLQHAWRPDWHLRLVNRQYGPSWQGGDVHEYLTVEGKVIEIQGEMYHYSYRDLSHHFKKIVDYARLSAGSYHKRGKKFSLLNLILNPSIAFWKELLVRQAWRDGIRGFIIAMSTFVTVFLKYAMLWELQHSQEPAKRDHEEKA